jgi:hypothetical protein
MACNSSKDEINSNRLPRFLFTSIWLLSEDASDASEILGQWGDVRCGSGTREWMMD